MYGHIKALTEAESKGIKAAGGKADIYQIAETLPDDVLTKMYAPPKSEHPIATPETLKDYDAVLFGISTRFVFPLLSNLDEIHGGSPWGAGTFASADGSRQPTALELSIAEEQGKAFYQTVSKFVFA
ncbi:hypothetical protein ZTR_06059 [Talaromyces verruculosus]|nr:hypothetical protein ZTR_06059 [Talaromyces verruculosus]